MLIDQWAFKTVKHVKSKVYLVLNKSQKRRYLRHSQLRLGKQFIRSFKFIDHPGIVWLVIFPFKIKPYKKESFKTLMKLSHWLIKTVKIQVLLCHVLPESCDDLLNFHNFEACKVMADVGKWRPWDYNTECTKAKYQMKEVQHESTTNYLSSSRVQK